MASRQVLLLAALAAVACLASVASAMQWTVGDDGGWRAKFNTTGWTNGKTFVVGDSLMFMYTKDNHTVIQVGKDDFLGCNLKGNQINSWYSGMDVVQLDKPGKVWFICSKPSHCDNGMKMAIDVQLAAAGAPAPAVPAPPSSAPAVGYTVGGAVAVVAGAVVAAVLAF